MPIKEFINQSHTVVCAPYLLPVSSSAYRRSTPSSSSPHLSNDVIIGTGFHCIKASQYVLIQDKTTMQERWKKRRWHREYLFPSHKKGQHIQIKWGALSMRYVVETGQGLGSPTACLPAGWEIDTESARTRAKRPVSRIVFCTVLFRRRNGEWEYWLRLLSPSHAP